MSERTAARITTVEGLLVHARRDLGTLIVTGKDRATWLNGLVTCDLAKAKAGDGVWGLAVGKTGKVLVELWIVVADDRLVVAVDRAKLAGIVEHFDRHLIMEDAAIEDASDATTWLALVGPGAKAAVASARELGAAAAPLDWTGRGDAAVVAGPATIGAALGGAVASDADFDALRVAWGLPRFGVDYTEENLPQEASLEKLAVSFSKGCYLGQEAVFMLEARGHAKKHLARLEVEGAVAVGAEVTLPDGSVVGSVTSVAGGHALAFVKHKHATPGAELVVAGNPARLVDLAARPQAPQPTEPA